MDSLRLYGLVTAGAAALLGAYVWLRRKPKTASEIERERRKWLEGIGRITDGTVIDVQELAAARNHHAAIMLIYKYDVAGVSYECSRCDLSAALDQPALVPPRPAHVGEVRSA